jgi:hypothetical protein
MENKLEFTGKITHISAVEHGEKNGKGWSKQFIVIEDDAKFANSVKLDFFNKEEVQNKAGQIVKAVFNAKVNEYNGKYYQSLSGWKIEVLQDVQAPQKVEDFNPAPEALNDLPF